MNGYKDYLHDEDVNTTTLQMVTLATKSQNILKAYPILFQVAFCFSILLGFSANKLRNLIQQRFFPRPERLEAIYSEKSTNLFVNNPDENSFDFSTFKVEVCIGRGGFGTVNLCSILSNQDRKFAVKHLDTLENPQVNTSF